MKIARGCGSLFTNVNPTKPVIRARIVIIASMLLKMQGCVPFKMPEKVWGGGCCYFLSSSLSTIFLYAS